MSRADMIRAAPLLVLFIAGFQSGYAQALSPPRPFVLLLPDRKFASIELLTEQGPGGQAYMRNQRFGRFVSQEELDSAVPAEYFNRIRGSTRTGSALRSLAFLNADARSSFPCEEGRDRFAFLTKLGLLGLTGVTFLDASRKARVARQSIRYVNSATPVSRFEQARNFFYLSAAATIGYNAHVAWSAYSRFGHRGSMDLEIPLRMEVEADSFLRTEPQTLRVAKTLAWDWR